MRILERMYVKDKEDPTKTLSWASKILHEGAEYPTWYPSNRLTPEQAAYVIRHKDRFYFNIFAVPEEEQEVVPLKDRKEAKSYKASEKGTFKKGPAKMTKATTVSADDDDASFWGDAA